MAVPWPAADGFWEAGFGLPGVDNRVSAILPDGRGTIYVGGTMSVAGNVAVDGLAAWDGETWRAVDLISDLEASPFSGQFCALALDGGGNLVAGGRFGRDGDDRVHLVIVRSEGVWRPLGAGMSLDADRAADFPSGLARVAALAVGRDRRVYAGGSFDESDGAPGNYVAVWDGLAWSGLAEGPSDLRPDMGDGVRDLVIDEVGQVYIAGSWDICVQMWNGEFWHSLATGCGVVDLALDESGRLYAAGEPWTMSLARWDGQAWSELGRAYHARGPHYSAAAAVAVDPNGGVYLGGNFTEVSGEPARNIARWDGIRWSPVGDGLASIEGYEGWAGQVGVLAIDERGDLFAAGSFHGSGDKTAINIARWDGERWQALGEGQGAEGLVRAVAVGSDGTVYAGGDLQRIGDTIADHIAAWNGANWQRLGPEEPDLLWTAYHLSAGQGSALFATRGYDEREHGHSQGNDATDIEEWDGTSWVRLPPFWDTDRQWEMRINAIEVGPDGDLFMTTGSIFTSFDPSSALARWNGEHWSAMAAWPAPYYESGGNFTALAVCPDEAVYTSARIQGADGGEKQGILRWDGESWAVLDGKGGCTWSATALACDGDGQVYGHVSCGDWSGVAHWSGNDWNPLGDGLNTKDSPAVVSVDVSTLVVDAAGRLYAARVVADTLRDRVSSVLRWDGRQWEALGARVNGEVRSMAVGPGSLWVGGLFTVVDGVAAAGIAKWVDPSISPVALEPNSISEEAPDLPLTVESPFPNPFRSQARLRYRTRSSSLLRVTLYDLLGRRLANLFEGDTIAGQRGQVFVNGSGLPGGTYVVRFETVESVVTKVVQLVR